MFTNVRASEAERAETRPGDALVPLTQVVMDRGFTVAGSPDEVWPWIQQLGKRRAGWYFSRRIERFIPRGRRAINAIDPRWQRLTVGDVIPDYGGANEQFTVAQIEAPHTLVYTSRRGHVDISWSIVLRPTVAAGLVDGRSGIGAPRTRVLLRLRMGPIKRVWLARSAGELIDLLTIAGMAAGLRERLTQAGGGAKPSGGQR